MSAFPNDAEREAAREAMGVWQGTARDVHVLDALAPHVEARVRQARAEAWDEGCDAGHLMARALNPEWPEQTPNPYRERTQDE